MSFKVVVDWDLCRDHAQCTLLAPEVFELGDDGRMHVLVEQPDDALRSRVEDAVDTCPMQAISIQG